MKNYKNLQGFTNDIPSSNLEGLERKAENFMNLIKDTVINNNNLTPTEFYLSQNYPNPFKERTAIKYCVAYKTKVKLEVFNAEGEMIKVLVDEEKEPGTYEVKFNSIGIPEGFYLYQLQAGDFSSCMKMIVFH